MLGITITVYWDKQKDLFIADCENLPGSPRVGFGYSIEHAVCSLVGIPDHREIMERKAKI